MAAVSVWPLDGLRADIIGEADLIAPDLRAFMLHTVLDLFGVALFFACYTYALGSESTTDDPRVETLLLDR